MGKVRIKTIGVEEEEDKQKKQAAKRADKKREQGKTNAEETQNHTPKDAEDSVVPREVPQSSAPAKQKKKPSKYKAKKKQQHSSNYLAIAKLIDKDKKHTLEAALKILLTNKTAKFDETVELHINTLEKGISGRITLPY